MKTLRLLLASFLFISVATQAALPGADALAGIILKEFDTNADQQLDAGEWQAGIGGSFTRLDQNGDGSVQPDEADALKEDIAAETGEISAAIIILLIKQIITGLDTDNDKLVSRKEYDELSTSVFTKLDADKNNSLTLAEIGELPVKLIAK